MRILIIEDNKEKKDRIINLLDTKYNHKLDMDISTNLESAKEKIEKFEFDLYILDLSIKSGNSEATIDNGLFLFDILIKKENPLFKGIETNKKFYFVHSYHFVSHNQDEILTTTDYEYSFVSSIWKENIFGVQFHPEKSHEQGDILLKNFYNL